MKGTRLSMAAFASYLAREMDRPVIDNTGVKGEFDVKLEWAPDGADGSSGPSIFTALQEQLGLRFESGKRAGGNSRHRQRGQTFGELMSMTVTVAIRILAAQPWVERLGWTLVHFLWQGALIAVLYVVARRWMGSSRSAQARYLLACLALLAMVAEPIRDIQSYWFSGTNAE